MDVQHTEGDAITGISSMATRHVLTALAGAYERQSGQRVRIESTGGVDAARRVLAGERFDFVVLASQALEGLAAAGRIDPGSRVGIARSRMAIAVRAGEPLPEAGTETALRDALLAARSIGYSTGPSGSHLLRLFERWGVAERVASRIVQAPPGVPVGTLVARGEVELGVQQLSELIDLPGIDVTDALPTEIEATTLFSAAMCMPCRRHEATGALLAFLASPEAGPAKLLHGMEPA